jgi:hypothetical protein
MTDSDDGEMVVVGKYTTKNRNYHTNPDCCNYPQNPREIKLSIVEDRGFEECDVCSGDIVRTKRHGESLANRLEQMSANEI